MVSYVRSRLRTPAPTAARPAGGDTWPLDELLVAIKGRQQYGSIRGFPTPFWGLSGFFVGDLIGKALWELVENAQRFPRHGGRVLCVHGAVSFHRARPCATRWLPGRGPCVMSNWTAASSDCSRPANNYVRVNTVDLYTPNARFTPERLGYQVLTLFAKLGYSQQYLWRAVDEDGDVLDILVQSRRNRRAAVRFFRKLLKKHGFLPRRLVTDQLRSYPAAHRTVMPFGGPSHRAGCEPPSRGVASTDAAARAQDATLQVSRPVAAVRVRPRRGAQSLSRGPTLPWCTTRDLGQ